VVPYDLVAWFISLLFATILRFEFRLDAVPFVSTAVLAVLLSSAALLVGFGTHLYRNRYVVGSLDELRALVITIFVVAAGAGSIVALLGNQWGLPRSTVFIAAPIFLLLSGGLRAYLRFVRLREVGSSGTGRRALIYGAGDAAEALIPQLLGVPDAPYEPVVLLDDSPHKANRWIRGVPMGGRWNNLSQVVEKYKVDTVIVAIPSATSELLSKVYADGSRLGLQVVVLPSLREYLGGRTTATELRNVSIEDLLGRQSVELDSALISRLIRGKRVLVTGAGGSIGSELSRQIAEFGPKLLTLVDRDETGLLIASMGIPLRTSDLSHETYLADIRDKEAVRSLFQSRNPEVVFHAAALKHLPILEAFPREAWKTNVEGTLNILEAAQDVGVSVFVNISTDKAANPVNALGRSKKLGEELTAWFGLTSKRPYVSVRFGNVLGSRGSLIPVIAEQISGGGPVTITDKAATRYFMSIPEACQLVLQAAAQGEEGDVMVLDMGSPVNINHIAERMIELSGKNVAIEYIGLRPGEKLHEDLLSDSESPLPSLHPKILRLKATSTNPSEVLASPWP
jgi:FlaA1/EpsC-like NDP-sugar epimerase